MLLLVVGAPSLGVMLLLLLVGELRYVDLLMLLGLGVSLHLVDGIALALSDAVHRQQVYLQILLGLELLGADVTGDVLRLYCVHVDDVLLEIGIVGVDLAALGTLGLALETVGVLHLLLERMQQSQLLDLLLGAGLQHEIELLLLVARLLLLLEALQIVLKLLVHDGQLVGAEAAQGVQRLLLLLRLLLAGGRLVMQSLVPRGRVGEPSGAGAGAGTLACRGLPPPWNHQPIFSPQPSSSDPLNTKLSSLPAFFFVFTRARAVIFRLYI